MYFAPYHIHFSYQLKDYGKFCLCLQDKQLRDVGDWRKNIEDKSDRKKMFDS